MLQYSQEAALGRQIKYQNFALILIESEEHIYDFLASEDPLMMQTILRLLATMLILHHVRRLVVNDIDVNHLQDSIEDIMGDYVESPEYNKRIQEVNKLYYDFRSTLLPAKQPIFDQIFLEMQAINDDFAMQAFKRGITYGKSESYER